jgi:hypothetical protein
MPGPKPGPRGKAKQIDAFGGDVFADLSGKNGKPGCGKLAEQLTVDQMDLPQIRLRRIASNAGSMFYRRPAMRVTVHTETLAERDMRHRRLGERVPCALVNGMDDGGPLMRSASQA